MICLPRYCLAEVLLGKWAVTFGGSSSKLDDHTVGIITGSQHLFPSPAKTFLAGTLLGKYLGRDVFPPRRSFVAPCPHGLRFE